MLTADGSWVIAPCYHEPLVFYDGLARAARKQGDTLCYGLINQAGEEVIPINYRQLIPAHREWSPAEAVMACNQNNRWGAFSTTGHLIVPFEYDDQLELLICCDTI